MRAARPIHGSRKVAVILPSIVVILIGHVSLLIFRRVMPRFAAFLASFALPVGLWVAFFVSL
jgi:type II secretory pathway component PulF